MDNTRDFYLARLATAAASARNASDTIAEIINYCVDPSDDTKGEERELLLEAALDELGIASRCIEAAREAHDDLDYKQGEPDFTEDDDEEDGDTDGEEAA